MKLVKTIKSVKGKVKAKKGNIKLAAKGVGTYILGIGLAPILIPMEAYHCIKYGESFLDECIIENAETLIVKKEG